MRGNRVLVLLRGVNVGGRHPLAMPALRAVFAELGCDRIDTYLQSGNLVCTAHASLTSGTIAAELARHFGFPIPVVLRTAEELDASIAANPFTHRPGSTRSTLLFWKRPLPRPP